MLFPKRLWKRQILAKVRAFSLDCLRNLTFCSRYAYQCWLGIQANAIPWICRKSRCSSFNLQRSYWEQPRRRQRSPNKLARRWGIFCCLLYHDLGQPLPSRSACLRSSGSFAINLGACSRFRTSSFLEALWKSYCFYSTIWVRRWGCWEDGKA